MTPLRASFVLSWGRAGNRPSGADGVRRKIGEQIRHWRSQGAAVHLFVTARADCRQLWLTEVDDSELTVTVGESRIGEKLARLRTLRAITRWAPTFCYMRQELYSLELHWLMRHYPTFVEINGDDVAVARPSSWRGVPHWAYRWITRPAFFHEVRGLLPVSHELAREAPFARHMLPTHVIANGIDIEQFTPLAPATSEKIEVVLLGSQLGAKWHGADKLVELARRRPDWQIHIVGCGVNAANVPANAHVYPQLTRDEYLKIFERCTVGFGTLSAYEKSAHEASPLKVREYLASGIPTITGVTDTDFPNGADFLLTLPNTPDNIATSLPQIDDFVLRWRGRRVPRAAISKIDWKDKERTRLAFVSEVLRMDAT